MTKQLNPTHLYPEYYQYKITGITLSKEGEEGFIFNQGNSNELHFI